MLLSPIRDYTDLPAKIDFFRFHQRLAPLLFVFCLSCSGIEQTENEKLRRKNCKGEYIYRTHDDYSSAIPVPAQIPRPPYPWERSACKITRDFFRCKGDPARPSLPNREDEEHPFRDCDSRRHGLPVLKGQETVYPILLELLNYVQERTGKKVIVTCGHRCPQHNSYADPSKENRLSKHQIGAEVDFYVQGLQQQPEDIVQLIMNFYKEDPRYQGEKAFETFLRYEKSDVRCSTQPWMNKEIFIQLFLPHEGRDIDNDHPYPYLSIQVRLDRDTQQKVVYEWKKAHLGYPRG